MPGPALCVQHPHSFSSWYFLRFTSQVDVGHLILLLHSRGFAKLCLLWILLWRELSFTFAVLQLHIYKCSSFLSQPLHSSCHWHVNTREKECGEKTECGLGEPLANGTMSGWLVSRLIWSQRCQNGEKTGDAGFPGSEMATGKLKDRPWQSWRTCHFLDQIAGLNFYLELVSFQATVSYLCSLFSVWLCFFPITIDYDIRAGGVGRLHLPVQPPSVRSEESGSREAMTSSRSHSKLVEELRLEAHLPNRRPKLSSLMDSWLNLWNSAKADFCWSSCLQVYSESNGVHQFAREEWQGEELTAPGEETSAKSSIGFPLL